MNKQEILSAFLFRHACKEFDPAKKIPEEDFLFILETGRLSPSSLGFEPWKFLVVQDPVLREKLKDGAWGATVKLDTASHFIVCLTMKAPLIRYNSPYILDFMSDVQKWEGELLENRKKIIENFQKVDFGLETDEKLFEWSSKQCYIALANMLTSAAMIGIDSCPIEGFNRKNTERVLKEQFGIDTDQYGISYMTAFGYRIRDPRPKTRRPLNEVVIFK